MKREKTNPLPKMIQGVVCGQWVRVAGPIAVVPKGRLHGPYPYLFWRERGKLRKRYVKPADVDLVRAASEARRQHRHQLSVARDQWLQMASIIRQAEQP